MGLTGHFDETAFRAVTTGDRELNFLYLSHDEPIGSSGARVGVSVNASDSHVTDPVSYTHLRAHETVLDLVCRLLLEKKKPIT